MGAGEAAAAAVLSEAVDRTTGVHRPCRTKTTGVHRLIRTTGARRVLDSRHAIAGRGRRNRSRPGWPSPWSRVGALEVMAGGSARHLRRLRTGGRRLRLLRGRRPLRMPRCGGWRRRTPGSCSRLPSGGAGRRWKGTIRSRLGLPAPALGLKTPTLGITRRCSDWRTRPTTLPTNKRSIRSPSADASGRRRHGGVTAIRCRPRSTRSSKGRFARCSGYRIRPSAVSVAETWRWKSADTGG